jgi:hypothetical protein
MGDSKMDAINDNRPDMMHDSLRLSSEIHRATLAYLTGILKYGNEFSLPFWTALNAFLSLEKEKVMRNLPWETLSDYIELLMFNLQVAEKGLTGSLQAMRTFNSARSQRWNDAFLEMTEQQNIQPLIDLIGQEAGLLEGIVYAYPKAIRDIKPEYGLHPESDGYEIAGETERFRIYRVLPQKGVEASPKTKPILIIPPYVLGPNILAFLPGEQKSYVHAYANQGIPTYIRIIKDIDTTPAVQTITPEEDILDIQTFCRTLYQKHGRPVTLNGFCQGGFLAIVGLLSGELDDTVDALITCVAPMDGTRSKALVEYMQHLPPRFRDLGYALKPVASGNKVVDGKVMSWVYKLKSMENEAPLFTFYRDLMLFSKNGGGPPKISKTAAAINHWLIYDRNDLPEAITRLSFDSYTIPVTDDGTLPVKLFGRKLNFKRLQEKGIRYLICYGADDDLVDKEAALAPLDFIDAEVTCFPKGHGAIATSWSHPESACALQTRFGENQRGPVRFQLDLDSESDNGSQLPTPLKS